LQLDSLCKKRTEKDILDALEAGLTSSLHEIYGSKLREILDSNKATRRIAEIVFTVLLYTKEPLHPSAWYQMLRSEPGLDDISSALDYTAVCGNLVIWDASIKTFRFCHASAQDFVREQSSFSPSSAHSLLAEICLRQCSLGPSEFFSAVYLSPVRDFYQYAALHWPTHVREHKLQHAGVDHVDDKVSQFAFVENTCEVSPEFVLWLDCIRLVVERLPPYDSVAYIFEAIQGSDMSPIFPACVLGLANLLAYILEMGAHVDLEQINETGHTPLYLACAYGHTDVVSILLKHGAKTARECGSFGSPLHVACFRGHKAVVDTLLSQGVTDHPSTAFQSSLEAACSGGSEPTARYLIEKGSLIQSEKDFDGILRQVIEAGFASVSEWLSLPGTTATYIGKNKMASSQQDALISSAIQRGSVQVLQGLLRSRPELRPLLPVAAIAKAAQAGHATMISFLHKEGLDPDVEGPFGPALRCACAIGNERVLKELLSVGVDAKTPQASGDALQVAAQNGHVNIIKILLGEGVDVNEPTKPFGNSLLAACFRGHKSTVEFLLDHGADMHQSGDHGDAMQAATKAGHVDVASCLLERGYVARSKLPAVARGDHTTPRRPAHHPSERTQMEAETNEHSSMPIPGSSQSDSSASDDELPAVFEKSRTPDIPEQRFQLAAYLGNLSILRQRLLQLKPGMMASVEISLYIAAAASSGQVKALKLLMLEGLKHIELRRFELEATLVPIINSGRVEAFIFVLGWYFEHCAEEKLEWRKILCTAAGASEPKFMASLLGTIPESSHLDALLVALPIAIQHEESGVAALLWSHLCQSSPLLIHSDRPYPIQRIVFLQPYINTSSDVGRERAKLQLQKLIVLSLEYSDLKVRHDLLEVVTRAGFDVEYFFAVLVQACQRGLASFMETFMYTKEKMVIQPIHVHKLLSMAVVSGHMKIVRSISEEVLEESTLDALASSLTDSLTSAAFSGHHKVVGYLFGSKKLRNLILESDSGLLLRRMLAAAAEGGHLRVVRLCYEEGADMNAPVPPMPSVRTPEEYAHLLLVEENQEQIAETVDQETSDYSDSDSSVFPTLAQGIARALPQPATLLPLQAALRGYARFRKQVECHPRVPYKHLAGPTKAEECQNLIVSELLQQGADPNDHGSLNRTPLQLAASYAGDSAVQLLLENDASVNDCIGGENESLIALAAVREDELAFRVIARLVTARAGISSGKAQKLVNHILRTLETYISPWGKHGRNVLFRRDHTQELPLSLSLAKKLMDGGILPVLRKVFDYMPDINPTPKDRSSLMTVAELNAFDIGGALAQTLVVAAVAGNLAAVQLLIKRGVSRDVPLGGESALDGAARLNQIPVMKALLKAGSKPTVEGAIRGGSLSALKLMLEKGAVTDNDSCALERAVKRGNIRIVQTVLEHTRNTIEISNALFHACDVGNPAMVDVLLQAGASVNYLVDRDIHPRRTSSSLFVAVERGHEQIVRKLLENDADPNMQTGDDLAFPLIAATSAGCLRIVQLLLQHGADANRTRPKQSKPDQRWFASTGQSRSGHDNTSSATHHDFRKVYLDHDESGSEWEDEDESLDEDDSHPSQQDPHQASFLDIMELLTSSVDSHDPSTKDETALCPLQLACEAGFLEIAQALIAHGAIIADTADCKSPNPFLGCLDGEWSSSKKAILQMLCEHALVAPHWDTIGRAALAQAAVRKSTNAFELLASNFPPSEMLLFFACMCGSMSTIRACVECGFRLDGRLPHGLAPLHLSALFLQDDLVSALLIDGTDPNLVDALGQTPLTCAILGFQRLLQVSEDAAEEWVPLHIVSFERIVEILLDSGADVDGGSDARDRALHLACFVGHVPIARLLIQKTKEIDQWAGDHGTPLFAALDGDWPEILTILLEYGADVNQRRHLEPSHGRSRLKYLHRAAEDQGSISQTAVEAAFGKSSPTLLSTFLCLAPDVDVSGVLVTALNSSFGRPSSCPPLRGHTIGRPSTKMSDFELLLSCRPDLNVSEEVIGLLLDLGHSVQPKVLDYALDRSECGLTDQLITRATSQRRSYAYSVHRPWSRSELEEYRKSNRYSEQAGNPRDVNDASALAPDEQSNALEVASARGDLAMVKRLLDSITDGEVWDGSFDNALKLASGKGHKDVVRLLLEKGASGSHNIGGENALSVASYGGHKSVLDLLLAVPGHHPDHGDHYGRTPLWWAAAGGNGHIVKLLLGQYNSDPCKADWLGRSPALIAARNGNYAAMDVLLSSIATGSTSEYERTIAAFTANASWREVFCDICTVPIQISDQQFHCRICSGGDWDMCKECKEGGASCYDTSHSLIKRVMRDGSWTEIVDESAS
jgi:ankyrin repeat protein